MDYKNNDQKIEGKVNSCLGMRNYMMKMRRKKIDVRRKNESEVLDGMAMARMAVRDGSKGNQ
jgi:hypothetical protein